MISAPAAPKSPKNSQVDIGAPAAGEEKKEGEAASGSTEEKKEGEATNTASKITLKSLREFLNTSDSKFAEKEQLHKAYKVVQERIPEVANFPVRDASVFNTAFRQHLLQLQEQLEDPSKVGKLDDVQVGLSGEPKKEPDLPSPNIKGGGKSKGSWID